MGVTGQGASAEVFLGMNIKKFLAATKKGVVASKAMVDKLAAHQRSLKKIRMQSAVALGVQLLFINKVTTAAGKPRSRAQKRENGAGR